MATINEHISKDSKKSYRVRIKQNGRVVASKTFPTKTEAKRWGNSTEAAIRERRYFPKAEAEKHTVGDAIKRYLETVMPGKSPASIVKQTQQLGWWRSRIGNLLISEVTPAVIVEQRDQILADSAPATANRYLAAISHVFTILVKEWHWCDHNPCENVSRRDENNERTRYRNLEERDALLIACRESESPDLYLAVLVALYTGGRRMEVLGLEWRDVSLERRTVTFRNTKNGDIRSILR